MRDALRDPANRLLRAAHAAGLTVAVAESCTAGLLCQVLADAEGAGTQFAGGFITYTKAQKTAALGVPAALLAAKTAVCREVASAMAEGVLLASAASAAASITGVGAILQTVVKSGTATRAFEFNYGDLGRDAVRERAVADALQALTDTVTAVSAAA